MLRKLTVEESSCVCFFIKYVNETKTLFLKILNNDIFLMVLRKFWDILKRLQVVACSWTTQELAHAHGNVCTFV